MHDRDSQRVDGSDAPRHPDRSTEVVFLLGITGRSGTNHLQDLLTLHPHCRAFPAIWEDYLLANSEKLLEFVEIVAGSWLADWDIDGRAKVELTRSLGNGCLSFLTRSGGEVRSEASRYVVTKSPTVKNLELLPTMFPSTKTLVLIRDGRDVVESAIRTFNWGFDEACRRWAAGAKIIMSAREQRVPFLQVRFEDLVGDCRLAMKTILAYLGLEQRDYDFVAAESLPVRGSSTFGRQGARVHWEPVPRTSEFQPVRRWKSWGEAEHERFGIIAGEWQQQLGYDLHRS